MRVYLRDAAKIVLCKSVFASLSLLKSICIDGAGELKEEEEEEEEEMPISGVERDLFCCFGVLHNGIRGHKAA
jgi:hypothetical protein